MKPATQGPRPSQPLDGSAVSNARVVIVDTDPTAWQALTDGLHGVGHMVCGTAASGKATELAADLRPDLALVGLGSDQGADGGVEAAEQVRRRFAVPVVFLPDPTTTDDALLHRSRLMAPCGYVMKPVDPRQLRLSIDAALCAHARERTLNETVADLRRQATITETVMDCMDAAVLAVDADGHVLAVNPTARRLIGRGRTSGDVAYWSEHYDFYCADGRTPLSADDTPLSRALRGEPSDHVEVIVRSRKTGEVLYFVATGRPLLDSTGRSMGGIVVFRDSTPLHETKERLQESLDKLKQQQRLMGEVFNSMSDGVVAVDEHGRYLVVNEIARAMVGDIEKAWAPIEQRPQAHGIYLRDGATLCPPDELPIWRSLQGERVDNVELCIRPPGRSRSVPVSVNGRPLRTESGAVRGAVVVVRDISVLRERQAELARTIARLHEQVQLMEVIFNSMSDGWSSSTSTGSSRCSTRAPNASSASGGRTPIPASGPRHMASIYRTG